MKNVGKKVLNVGKNIGKKVVNVGKKVITKGVNVGKQVLQKGVNLANQGLKKGVQIVKTVVPKVLGDVAQTAAASTVGNVTDAIQGDNGTDTGEEEVVYVDEQGNVIGQGFCGGAIYARGIYGGGGEEDEDYYYTLTSDGRLVPHIKVKIPSPEVLAQTSLERPIRVDQQLAIVPSRGYKLRGHSATDGARPTRKSRSNSYPVDPRKISPYSSPNSGSHSPKDRRRRNWRWPSFSIPRFNLPAGFHPPGTAMIKRLLYIGIVVLSFVLASMGAMRTHNQLDYDRTPWDRPDVQKRMMKYLDNNYGNHNSWLFPYQDEYITYPPDVKWQPDPVKCVK